MEGVLLPYSMFLVRYNFQGNMIAIHNIVAASATVGFLGKEGMVLKKTIAPTIYYLVVAGVLGLILVG